MSPIFTRCLRPLAFAMVAVSLAALPYRTLSAQPPAKKVVTVKGAKSRGAATDPNVKVDSLPSNQAGAAPVAAPPNKGGPKTRGATSGYLHVDNRTMWIIRIYVDGDYVGNVSRYGDSYGYYGCTNRTLYARAYFDDGSVISWGPTRADICDDYTWRLNP